MPSGAALVAGGLLISGVPGASSRSGDGGSVAITEKRGSSGGDSRKIGRREGAPEKPGVAQARPRGGLGVPAAAAR